VTTELESDYYKPDHNKKCVKKECINCGIAFHPSKNKQKYCSRACFDSHRETIDWPSLLELESMVAKNGYSKSGRILGVSNNAIKKRIEKIKSR
jgi:uncharacterized OB-fold protein